jgi:hypothetical protein
VSATPVRVTRNVPADDEHNFTHRDVRAGEVFYVFTGTTYGCIDYANSVALSLKPGEYPFFEFPRDAIEMMDGEQLADAIANVIREFDFGDYSMDDVEEAKGEEWVEDLAAEISDAIL